MTNVLLIFIIAIPFMRNAKTQMVHMIANAKQVLKVTALIVTYVPLFINDMKLLFT